MFRTASKRAPKPTERRPHSIVPVTLRRILVARGVVTDNPKYVNEALEEIDATKPTARFRHYAVNLAGFQVPVSPGEVLIWTSSDGFLDSPVLLDAYIKRRGVESSWCLATYYTSLDKRSVPVSALPRSVGTALKGQPVATITSRPMMRRLLALWTLQL